MRKYKNKSYNYKKRRYNYETGLKSVNEQGNNNLKNNARADDLSESNDFFAQEMQRKTRRRNNGNKLPMYPNAVYANERYPNNTSNNTPNNGWTVVGKK